MDTVKNKRKLLSIVTISSGREKKKEFRSHDWMILDNINLDRSIR